MSSSVAMNRTEFVVLSLTLPWLFNVQTLEGNTLSIIPQEMACGKWPYMSPEVRQMAKRSTLVLIFGLLDVLCFCCGLVNGCIEQPFDRSWQVYIEHNGIANADEFDYDAY
jgi:hypothetical protein